MGATSYQKQHKYYHHILDDQSAYDDQSVHDDQSHQSVQDDLEDHRNHES